MQAWKLISFEKVTNPVEGLKTQTWFEKIKLMLSIMVKLHSLIFNNDGIQTTSILLRQDIVKRKKRWKNDDNWYWEGVLKFNINQDLKFVKILILAKREILVNVGILDEAGLVYQNFYLIRMLDFLLD